MLEGMIERERGERVQQAGGDGHGPRVPAGCDAARKTAGGFQVHAEGKETEKLHEEEGAVGADLARGEAGGEIGGAPGDGAG